MSRGGCWGVVVCTEEVEGLALAVAPPFCRSTPEGRPPGAERGHSPLLGVEAGGERHDLLAERPRPELHTVDSPAARPQFPAPTLAGPRLLDPARGFTSCEGPRQRILQLNKSE